MAVRSTQFKVISNLIWRFAERCSAQIVQFVVSIILARILAPEAYGTIALVLVFAEILQVFVDSGLGNALIQKKDADDLDFSTVFYFNVFVCLILYAGIFFAAPLISAFYSDSSLTAVVRILSLTIVISGLKNVQQAYVSKTLQFKKFFWATLFGTILSGIAGIVIAMNGGGLWALVAQKIINLAVDTAVMWFTVGWRPKLMFSFKRLKGLISFGWKLLVSALLDTVYGKLRALIIGKMYSEADLAFYNQGNHFPSIVIGNINLAIDSVMLPVLSEAQDDRERVRQMARQAIKTAVFIMAPIMMGIFAVAPQLVSILLTNKWLPCVPFLRIFCVTYIFYPIHTTNLNAIKAVGRSDLFLKLEIIKKIVGMILLLSTMWFGVMAMAYSLLVSSVASQIINTWPNRKLLGYSYLNQLKDIFPSIIMAVFMGICVMLVGIIKMPIFLMLVVQVVFGAIIYIGGSILVKNDSFFYVWGIVQPFVNKFISKGKKK